MGEAVVDRRKTTPMVSSVNWGLLGLIIERPSYAYELARRFERTYAGSIALSSVSHVYTALANLRDRGLIDETSTGVPEPGCRRRYRASDLGLAEHARWLVSQVLEERRRQHVLSVQLGALARDPERALAVLDEYERACLAALAGVPVDGTLEQGSGVTRFVARIAGEETRLSIAAKLQWAQYARLQLSQLHALAAAVPSGGRAGRAVALTSRRASGGA